MKRIKKISIILIILIFIGTTTIASNFFKDVFGHWAEDTILWATNDVKIFVGYDDGTFRPNNNITRAEFIAILNRSAKLKGIYNEELNNKYSLPYEDVKSNFWGHTDIKKLGNYINTNGEIKLKDIFPGENFYPNKRITRKEAVLLSSNFVLPSINEEEISFKDMVSEEKFYDDFVKLVSNGIIVGYNDNTFRPNKNINRAEATVIIKRIYKEMNYLKKQYLTKIELINGIYDNEFLFMGDYSSKELSKNDKLFKRAIATLEYKTIVDKIPYEERHLYDSNPIETLKKLKENNYWNTIGLNHYIIQFGNINYDLKKKYSEEIIKDYINRQDIKSDESKIIFRNSIEYVKDKNLLIQGLNRWSQIASSEEDKLNIIFLKTRIYLINNEYEKALNLYNISSIKNLKNNMYYFTNKAYIYNEMGNKTYALRTLKNGYSRVKSMMDFTTIKEDYYNVVKENYFINPSEVRLIEDLREYGFIDSQKYEVLSKFIGSIKLVKY